MTTQIKYSTLPPSTLVQTFDTTSIEWSPRMSSPMTIEEFEKKYFDPFVEHNDGEDVERPTFDDWDSHNDSLIFVFTIIDGQMHYIVGDE